MTNRKLARLALGALVVLLAGLMPTTAEAQTLARGSSPVAHTSTALSTFHPWSLENAATNTDDKIAINGVASFSTPNGY